MPRSSEHPINAALTHRQQRHEKDPADVPVGPKAEVKPSSLPIDGNNLHQRTSPEDLVGVAAIGLSRDSAEITVLCLNC